MKKFILAACIVVGLLFVGYYAYYHMGFYVAVHSDEPVTTFMKTDEDTIYMERDGVYEPFEIRGVNLGVGIPGEWATDYAIDEETYLRWFAYIQELGANTIRVYTILQDDFFLQCVLCVQHRPGGGRGRTPVAHPRGVGQRLCAVLPPGRL